MQRKKIFIIPIIICALTLGACGSENSSTSKKDNTNKSVQANIDTTKNTSTTNSNATVNDTSKQASTTPNNSSTVTPTTTAKDTSKTTSTAANKNYTLTKKTFSINKVKINYPEISNLGDSSKQKKINDLIKNAAMQFYNNAENKDGLNIDINYEVKYESSNLISIEYLGYYYSKGAAHPENVMLTTNIDMNKETSIKFKDIITADKNFISKFKAGRYIPWSSDINIQSSGSLNEALNDINDNSYIQYFNQDSVNFYFTKDELVVSKYVFHAMGDHMEMGLKYANLSSNRKANDVWKDFIK